MLDRRALRLIESTPVLPVNQRLRNSASEFAGDNAKRDGGHLAGTGSCARILVDNYRLAQPRSKHALKNPAEKPAFAFLRSER